MNRFVSLLLSVAALTLATPTVAAPAQDPELWQALIGLRERGLVAGYNMVATSAASATGLATLGFGIAGHFNKERSLLGELTTVSGTWFVSALMLVLASEAIQARSQDRVHRLADIPRALTANKLERRHLRRSLRFLRRPLEDQYQRAQKDPELRAYLIALNQWLHGQMDLVPPPEMLMQRKST